MLDQSYKQGNWYSEIDFSHLMDLRVDYAFKLLFGLGDTMHLISLLNAIFANKKIPRKIISLTVMNPSLERRSGEDKLSTLDIRALLDNGTTVLIEMHLYGLEELKYKTIRSWARAYSEELKPGEAYSKQLPVVCVAFANGSIDDGQKQKIHKCCMITDIDDHTIFSNALELHYIDMKLFVETVNKTGGIGKGETEEAMLAKWLAVITEKDIVDKDIIRDICKEEEIGMVVTALQKWSEDKIARQAYQRRLEDVALYNLKIEEFNKTIKNKDAALADKDAALADKDAALADKDAALADNYTALAAKDAALADNYTALAEKDAEIEKMRLQLAALGAQPD
jgi:predicted transposase/invertase (TIGR01784 family)